MSWLRRATIGIGWAFCSAVAWAQGDLIVYGEALQNGWQDWSWCTRDLASTDYAHAGSRSVKVTMAAGWQGFYLSHGSMSTVGFTTLEFYVHGGTVSNRTLRVAGVLAGSAGPTVDLNPFIAGGSIAAGQWRRVSIPLSALGAAGASNFTGFWIQESAGVSQPAFYLDDIVLKATAPPSSVNLTVDLGHVLQIADPRMFALNGTMWDAQFNTATTRSLLLGIQNRALRIPGGSLSNEYHWATNTTLDNTWTWATDFNSFASVARDTGSQLMVTTNYGTGTPQEAAAWVHYANVVRAYGVRFWEIGNECYGQWETDHRPRPHDPYSYALAARDYIQQMKAVDPSVKVGVVTPLGEEAYANYTDHPAINPRTLQVHNGWGPVMLSTLRSLGVTPDFLIYHKYHQEPGQESDAGLLQSSTSWADDIASLRLMLDDYLGSIAANVEIVCTENNSVSHSPGKQTTSLVNGLFWADSVGQALKTELRGLYWWDVRNSPHTGNNNSPSLYGWRGYGDYGIISISNGDLHPAYYSAKLVKEFARGGEQVLATTSDYALLSIYAARQPNGTTRLLIINKSPTLGLPGNIVFSGPGTFSPAATVHRYGIPQDEAARTGIGSRDVSKATARTTGRNFSMLFPPYSMSVIVLPPKGVLPPP
ncbi:MAG TPA: hypothetical protein PLL78_10410 [Fimbriimonadaceae bacterium]|nr:hypothetical protein [Fimbriimonadaceae bacterium]HRJ97087.1 hypothetical protein [Fimbriimonadaceae bacterium]